MTDEPAVARTVPELLAWRAARQPDRVAIEVRGIDSLTFARWDATTTAVAAGLSAIGLRHGDCVGLVFGARDWVDFAIAYCGVQRAGGVAVPLSDRLAPVQLRYALEHCSARVIVRGANLPTDATPYPDHGGTAVTPQDQGGTAVTPQDQGGTAVTPQDHGGTTVAGLVERGAGGAGRLAEVRAGDLAQILYTSGTTGRPKGVAATHANLMVGVPRNIRRLALAHSERFLHAFAIGTNAAQTMLLNALQAKPGALTLSQFTPVRFARLIERAGVGSVFLVPSMAIELLNSGALTGRDLSGVHLVGSTAAPLPPAVADRLAEAFPRAALVNYYTSTEAAPAQAAMMFDRDRPASVGRPISGALRIADAAGAPVPIGGTGEVWLRSPHPRAYFRDGEATAATFAGEWVRMGDVGRVDADGYLYLSDRRADVVKTGAFKVSTLEVEAAVYEHPEVAEAAAVGVPHPVLGAAIALAVVPRGSAGATALTLPALRGFLAGRLADYQLPTRVLVLDRLPRNDGGKVLKRQLTTLFQDNSDARRASADD